MKESLFDFLLEYLLGENTYWREGSRLVLKGGEQIPLG